MGVGLCFNGKYVQSADRHQSDANETRLLSAGTDFVAVLATQQANVNSILVWLKLRNCHLLGEPCRSRLFMKDGLVSHQGEVKILERYRGFFEVSIPGGMWKTCRCAPFFKRRREDTCPNKVH